MALYYDMIAMILKKWRRWAYHMNRPTVKSFKNIRTAS